MKTATIPRADLIEHFKVQNGGKLSKSSVAYLRKVESIEWWQAPPTDCSCGSHNDGRLLLVRLSDGRLIDPKSTAEVICMGSEYELKRVLKVA